MHIVRTLCLFLWLAAGWGVTAAHAQDINLLPKFGGQPKNEAQKAADAKFLAKIDDLFKGNRQLAAEVGAGRGWHSLKGGRVDEAMMRFNQAWLLDPHNGMALWGMAVAQTGLDQPEASLKLFEEAEKTMRDNLDFACDYAMTLAMVGTQKKNPATIKNALNRYASIHDKAPQHIQNLQNWAITYYHMGNYAEAWKKIKLAEATPQRTEIDAKFVAALQTKMPRP